MLCYTSVIGEERLKVVLKKKVYIETSFISYLCGKRSDNLIISSNQKITHDWWDKRKQFYNLFSSELVYQEIIKGDKVASIERIKVFDSFDLLELNDMVKRMAGTLLAKRVLSAKAAVDAMHIALATVSGMDYLLTWNCKHIANAELQKQVLSVCTIEGHSMPVICTPLELMGR